MERRAGAELSQHVESGSDEAGVWYGRVSSPHRACSQERMTNLFAKITNQMITNCKDFAMALCLCGILLIQYHIV